MYMVFCHPILCIDTLFWDWIDQYWTGLKCVSFIVKPTCTKKQVCCFGKSHLWSSVKPHNLWTYQVRVNVGIQTIVFIFQSEMFHCKEEVIIGSWVSLNCIMIQSDPLGSNRLSPASLMFNQNNIGSDISIKSLKRKT